MDIKKTFGEKIKRLRKKRNLTQEQLAELIEIAPKNLSKIEVGSSFVSAETLAKIVDALDVTVEELFATNHIKPPEELLSDIHRSLEKIKTNQHKLETVFKMIEFIINS